MTNLTGHEVAGAHRLLEQDQLAITPQEKVWTSAVKDQQAQTFFLWGIFSIIRERELLTFGFSKSLSSTFVKPRPNDRKIQRNIS